MKNYLLIFLISSGVTFAQYTTPNTGVVWNADSLVIHSGGVMTGSYPAYMLNQKIYVSANDEVNIQAGSTISFDFSTAGFEVNGTFKTEGTETDSVYFTSPLQDSTGAYDGILFNAASGNSGMIQFTKIEYASYGVRCIDASPSISNSYLFKCDIGIQLSSSNAVVMNSKVERSYEYGILINLGSNPDIENNIIANNNTQNAFAKNQVSIGLQGNNSPIIKNNEIYGNTSQVTGGISLWVSGSASFSNMVCEGNTIHDNSFGITLYSSSDGIINAVVKDNEIYNNNLNPNVLTSGSGINVNGSPFNTPVITGNYIHGNWWGITIQNGSTVQAGPNPNIGNIENADTTDDGLNIIRDNIQGSDVFDLYNNCTNDIMAQNNDWGVYDSTLIEDHVFHKVDDPAHGLVVYMPFSPALPVELVDFTANLDGNLVELKWTTGTETNNKGFVVERKKGNEWPVIGFLQGKGNSTEPVNYSFSDHLNDAGIYCYRLRQIDFNGTSATSSVATVDYKPVNVFALEQNFPNPFNPSTIINYRLPTSGFVQLSIFNALGEKVGNPVKEFKPAGSYSIKFDGTSLASGIYIYRLETNGSSLVRKMLLLK